jgi:hypothetical protein
VIKGSHRLTFGLAVAATVWCFIAAAWMTTLPMMVGGRHPSGGEALAMVSIPAVASAFGSWAAWRGRRGPLIAAVVVVGLFVMVTGFSIGSAFYPTLGLLGWAIIASIDAGSNSEDGDTPAS